MHSVSVIRQASDPPPQLALSPRLDLGYKTHVFFVSAVLYPSILELRTNSKGVQQLKVYVVVVEVFFHFSL